MYYIFDKGQFIFVQAFASNFLVDLYLSNSTVMAANNILPIPIRAVIYFQIPSIEQFSLAISFIKMFLMNSNI